MSINLIQRVVSSFFLIIISFYITIKGSILFNIFLIIIFIISIKEWYKMSFNRLYFYPGVFFLILSFYTVFLMRSNDLYLFNFLILLSICIATDIGGFLFGKLFKGPKLTKISPNKTYSGMFGSYFTSFVVGILYIDYVSVNSIFIENKLSFLHICLLIILISSINQLGDLLISYFKRLRGFNDTGNMLPGHGGFLDRIDGLIFSILAGWVLINLFIL